MIFLVKFNVFISSVYYLCLLIFGLRRVLGIHRNNFHWTAFPAFSVIVPAGGRLAEGSIIGRRSLLESIERYVIVQVAVLLEILMIFLIKFNVFF